MIQYLIYAGPSSRDFGLFLSGSGTYGAPEKDLELTDVPGRNGSLIFDNHRFKNIEVTYPAFLYQNFDANMAGLRNFLLSKSGYQRLEDTYHPEEFRMALYAGPFEPDVGSFLRDGSLNLKFQCKPQRFLKSGEKAVTFTSSGSLYNPTLFSSRPLIRVYGSGTLMVGSTEVQVTSSPYPYIDIDCDVMDGYYGATNANQYLTLTEFPALSPGKTGVTIGTLTKVIVTPRWWML